MFSMVRPRTNAILAVFIFCLTAEVPVTDAAEAEDYRVVLDRYCVGCHNDRLQTAGISLDDLDVGHVATGLQKLGRKSFENSVHGKCHHRVDRDLTRKPTLILSSGLKRN
ncbi:MAG: hypothetical protein Ct9H300mP25_01830 [Acidobacteriota bacterium]|nr:MAG: hypothetical protein Ct9H300mP25_01830 [Acidobacteriota bacterium]